MADPSRASVDSSAARLAALGYAQPDSDDFIGGWVPDQPSSLGVTRGRHARIEPARHGGAVAAVLAERLRWLSNAETPSTRALLWLLTVCVGCILVTGYTVLHHRGQASYAAPPPAAQSFAPLPTPTPASIVVDVGGRVRRPGLVTLPLGSRVADALRAAGGALRRSDLVSLNLAAKVADGQLLLVGVPGASAGAASDGTTSGPLNLNSATADQLEALPGIGPVLAQHILDWRTSHGSFHSVDQLKDVSGIGDSTFADLAPLVTV